MVGKKCTYFIILLICSLLAVFCLQNNIFASENQSLTLSQESKENIYKSLFLETRENFTSQTYNLTEIEINLMNLEDYFQESDDEHEKLYWLARVKYLQGLVEKSKNDSVKAKEDFKKSKGLILSLLELYEFSDGYRLLADIEGQLMFYGDLIYQGKYGPQIKSWAEKAILLDPTNYQAYITLALYLHSAPQIVGGNPKKGKELLNKMIQLSQKDEIDNFSLFLWLTTAFEYTNYNQSKMEKYLEPLKLFSNQKDVQEMVEKLNRK